MIPVHEQNRLEQPMGGQDDVRWTEAAAGAPPQAAATADTSPEEFIREESFLWQLLVLGSNARRLLCCVRCVKLAAAGNSFDIPTCITTASRHLRICTLPPPPTGHQVQVRKVFIHRLFASLPVPSSNTQRERTQVRFFRCFLFAAYQLIKFRP